MSSKAIAPSKLHLAELSHVVKGAGITFIGMAAEVTIKYIYMIVIARMLGVKSFGIYMLAFTIISLAGLMSKLGLESGVIKYVSLYNGMGDRQKIKGTIIQSLKYTLGTSLLVGGIIIGAADYISVEIFKKPLLEHVLIILSISIPFLTISAVLLAATKGVQIMKYMAFGMSFFLPLMNLVLAVILVTYGGGIKGVAAAYLLATFLTFILAVFFLIRTFPDFFSVKAITQTKELLRFSLPVWVVMFFHFIIMWTDTLMLGRFRSSEDVGVYNGAVRIAYLTAMILMSFNAIFAPIIADLYSKHNIKKIEDLLKVSSKWIYTCSLPLCLLIFLLAEEIMGLFGPAFIVGGTVLVTLSIGQLLNAAAGPVGVVLTMTDRQDVMMYNTLGICMLNIILNIIFIQWLGIIGAAVASCISMILFNIIMLIEVYIFLTIHPFSLKYVKPTLFSSIIFITIVLWEKGMGGFQGLAKICSYGLVFMFLYIACMTLAGLDSEDKILMGSLKKKLSRSPAEEI